MFQQMDFGGNIIITKEHWNQLLKSKTLSVFPKETDGLCQHSVRGQQCNAKKIKEGQLLGQHLQLLKKTAITSKYAHFNYINFIQLYYDFIPTDALVHRMKLQGASCPEIEAEVKK